MTITDKINNEYFEWIYDLMCSERFSEHVSYRKLLMMLHDIEFTYIIPGDQNRAKYGLHLRHRFALDTGAYDAYEYLDGPCSVLEMMAALAIQCEEDIMDNTAMGDRTGQWFWGMIANLGLSGMTDNNFDRDEVEYAVSRLLNREYEPDGTGGLFTIRDCERDLRDVQIWFQLLWYLDGIV